LEDATLKTRTDLVHRALKNLGVLPQGQTPSAEEYNSVNALVDAMLEDLTDRDIIYIADADVIEERYFLALGNILAGHAAAEFGMQNDQAIAARMIKAEQDLNEMDQNSIRYLHMRTMHTDYYPRAVDNSTLFPST
jgi:F420-0:gamma-glutamyl ligase